MKTKLALAMIVRGTDEEAVLLERCLKNLSEYVDGIYLTITGKPGDDIPEVMLSVCRRYKANVSTFEWVSDFAAARNFNFSQVPKDYTHIMWSDADDMWRGLENLRDTIEENPSVDAFAFWYLYDFDEYKLATVVHKKTMIVKNDGCVTWAGELHEDFVENRQLNAKFVEGIERLHLTNEERIKESKNRNVEVSKSQVDKNPNDPRSYFNYANSCYGAGLLDEAIEAYRHFIETSGSEDEIYIARTRLADCLKNIDRNKAVETMYTAIGMRPEFPDAYLQLGEMLHDLGRYDDAEKYLLMGLRIKPQHHKMIVYNPRDYDYNPMMQLVKVYFAKGRPDLALTMLKGCLKIHPESKELQKIHDGLTKEVKRLEDVLTLSQELIKIEDLNELKTKIDALPTDIRQHPFISKVYNEKFIVTETSGKDIAYFCGYTEHTWDPKLFLEKGFGGSEEAVINLSREWVKQGYNVTVYNQCSEEMIVDGVAYKPWYLFNPRNKFDTLIFWRHPATLDKADFNCKELFIDMHDVIPPGEFTEDRLKKITKVFFKTNFHRSLFPNVPDEKCVIVPNGLDTTMFKGKEKKDPYLLFNSSSPDRSMDVLPKLFKKVKEQVPQARCVWAYGWDIFDQNCGDNKQMMEWKTKIVKEIEDAGIECLGKIPQQECAKWYERASILAYPSEFAEIDCISVKKAQLAGCVPVATTFGAFPESIKFGEMVESKKTKDNWCLPYQLSFGLEDEKAQEEWIEKTVNLLKNGNKFKVKEMKDAINSKYNWTTISKLWL